MHVIISTDLKTGKKGCLNVDSPLLYGSHRLTEWLTNLQIHELSLPLHERTEGYAFKIFLN